MIFLLSSCNNTQNKSKVPLKKENRTYQPVFLGLSPNMSENEFSTKIKELNKNGKLEDSEFPLFVDGKEFLFEINKKHNSIKLKYSDKYSVEKKYKSHLFYKKFNKEFSDKRVRYNSCKNNFLKILNKKYKLNEFQVPLNIDLEKIHLDWCDEYKIFVDKNKYIIFGTYIYGLEDPLRKEEDPLEILDNIIGTHDYGMDILIYYIPVENYQEFKNKIIKETKLKEYRENTESKKQKIKIQNSNEL